MMILAELIYGTIVAFLVFILSWLSLHLCFGLWFHADLRSVCPVGGTNAYSHFDPG